MYGQFCAMRTRQIYSPREALSEGEKRLLPFYGKHVFLCDD